MQARQVHHVKAGQGDTLQQHSLQVGPEAGLLHPTRQLPGGIGAVPAHLAAQNTFQAVTAEHRPHHRHVASVLGGEGGVIEAYYTIQVSENIYVTPDLQYLVNPGASTTADAIAAGLRLQIDF